MGSATDEEADTLDAGVDPSDGEGEDYESWLRRIARTSTTELAPLLPRAGQLISGKYRIEEELGRGGMGAVYRARHAVSDKLVAIKWMLRPAANEQLRERFAREARAAGRVQHPNVVDVYDIGNETEGCYLVMEHLRGHTLREELKDSQPAPRDLLRLLLPAMRGVAAAHRADVVHRDLKPDNIFLCESVDGGAPVPKVLDFGLSSIRAGDDDRTTLTEAGTLLGTVAYMPPEQLEDPRAVDRRADVYAFGVILYEALTGRLPFEADSHTGLVIKIVNDAPTPPRELRPELPEALEALVLRALHKDPAARFPDMDALIVAVEALIEGDAVDDARRASPAPTPTTGARAPGAIWVALILLTGGALALWSRGDTAEEASGGEVAAEGSSAEEAAQAPQVPASPTPTAEAEPEVEATRAAPGAPDGREGQDAVEARATEAPAPTPSARTAAPAATPKPARAPPAKAPRPATAPRKKAVQRSAPAPGAPPARSGSISLDDL